MQVEGRNDLCSQSHQLVKHLRFANCEGGSVSVANINEASLSISSGGGDVELGKVKASKATCNTAGQLI